MPTHQTLNRDQPTEWGGGPCLDADPGRSPADWRPIESARVLFLRNEQRCPVCRILQCEGAGAFGAVLHVVVSDGRLTVTEADNLHRPGRVLSGIAIAETPSRSEFALEAKPPAGLESARHLAAEGVATLTWGRAPRLRINARPVVRNATCDFEIDAVP